jgi:hypothetical protein
MAITSGQTTVGTAVVQIDGCSPNPSSLHIHNMDNTKVLYIGNSDVSITTGLGLQKLDSLEITLNPGEALYAISETGSHVVSWLRQTLY